MAITQAAADGDTAEVGTPEETNPGRSKGGDTDTEGSVNGGTVLARTGMQSGVNNATTDTGRTVELRPLLIPTKAYPPSRSTASPIDVDEFHLPIDADQFDRKSPVSINDAPPACDWPLDLDYTYILSPTSSQSHSHDIPIGPIAHTQLQFTIPVGNETPPLCHPNGTTMHHSKVWGQCDSPATSPNYTPSNNNRTDIVLIGFMQNEGTRRVDFPITNLQGITRQPDYIQVVITYDLFILAIVQDNPYLYGQALHIVPKLMTMRRPRYNPSNLLMFKMYNSQCAEMDVLVHSLEDKLALAKVHCWRKLMTEQAKLDQDMQWILQSVHNASMEQEQIQIIILYIV